MNFNRMLSKDTFPKTFFTLLYENCPDNNNGEFYLLALSLKSSIVQLAINVSLLREVST